MKINKILIDSMGWVQRKKEGMTLSIFQTFWFMHLALVAQRVIMNQIYFFFVKNKNQKVLMKCGMLVFFIELIFPMILGGKKEDI